MRKPIEIGSSCCCSGREWAAAEPTIARSAHSSTTRVRSLERAPFFGSLQLPVVIAVVSCSVEVVRTWLELYPSSEAAQSELRRLQAELAEQDG